MENNNIPLIVAHRGASAYAPENTLAAFSKAISMGADWAELDVQLTLDEQVVVIHDPTLERTTNFVGNVYDYTCTELQNADAGFWFAPEFGGEKIPTLEEVLDVVKGRMFLNIEIKATEEFSTLVDKVIHILRTNSFDNVFISSFSKDIIKLVKQKEPSIQTGYLFDRKRYKNVFEGDWEFLCPSFNLVNEDFISRAREAGKKIFAWTVNKPQDMQVLFGLGVDGIITNYPDILKKMLI